MKISGKHKRVNVKSLVIGDIVRICSTDYNGMTPNSNHDIVLDQVRINLLISHKKHNFVFRNKEDMDQFIEWYNTIRI